MIAVVIVVAVMAYLLGWANAAAFSLSHDDDDEPIEYYPTDEWNGGLL